MKRRQTERSTYGRSAARYSYPKGRLLPPVLDRLKISKFQNAKTSTNKRFLIMSAKSVNR